MTDTPREEPTGGFDADSTRSFDGEQTTSLPSPEHQTTAMPLPGDEPTLALGPGAPGATAASPTNGPQAASRATTVLANPRVAPYLAAADAALADLPPGERAELLEDLDAHLHEIVAEEGDAFESRLGSPSAYADEFRASAGYPPALATPTRRPGLTSRTVGGIRRWWQGRVDWVRGLPGGPVLLALLERLRPAWWVFRAWLAARLFGLDWPTGNHEGIGTWGAFCWQVAFVVLSVGWGLRTERLAGRAPRFERFALGVLNGVAALLCVVGVFGGGPLASMGDAGAEPEPYPIEFSGLSMGGSPITNLTAYDLEGNPIEYFQLFDQDGNAVVVDPSYATGPNGEGVYPVYATDEAGNPLNEVFPITYVLMDEYIDQATDTWGLQVSRILTPQRLAPQSGLLAPVVPPVGSVVPLDENGYPDWANAQLPPGSTPSPSPSPSGTGADPSPSPSPSGEATGKQSGSPRAGTTDKPAED